jgi:hypothetical protein
MLRLILLSLITMPLMAQGQGQAVNQVGGSPPNSTVQQFFYSGSNLTYACSAPAVTAVSVFYVASGTLTNVVVATGTGTINFPATAQLWPGMQITLAGSATTALNATYKVTAVSGSTATITTTGVANGTYADTSLTLSTVAPLLNENAWAIQVFIYAGSTLTGSYWAGTPSVTPSSGLACSNRANY